MKKVKLKALEAGAKELLSREQLKNVFGGCSSGACPSEPCTLSIGGSLFHGQCLGVSTQQGSSCNCGGMMNTQFDACNSFNEL